VSVVLMAVMVVTVCMRRSMSVSMSGIVRMRMVVRMGMRLGSVI